MNAYPLPRPEPLAYSPKDVCAALGCGTTFLYQEIAAGRLEARKMGKKTLIPAESLRGYLASLPKADIRTGQRGAA
jgi:excisionase family DNA binding protein